MFKTNARNPFAARSPDESDSDDNISLTSTLPDYHDPEEEFEVERILAEQRNEDGMTYYLVDWTGFELHESTWEPETELGEDLKAIWEATKARQATGELEPFDVQAFYDARDRAAEAKAERHRRRNAKRKRLGLPLTPPIQVETDSSDDEAVEDPVIEVADLSPAVSRPPAQQRIFKGIPSSSRPSNAAPAPGVPPSFATISVSGTRPQNESRRTSSVSQESGTETLPSNKRREPARTPSTGYQGTARKPSNELVSKPNARPANVVIPPAVPSSARTTPGIQKTLKAKKSTTQPTGNIFTGGKMRKRRANLKEAMSDPTKDQKFFEKFRYRRIAEKGSRDMEDRAPDPSKMRLLNITNLSKELSAIRRSSAGSIQSPTQQASPDDAIPNADSEPMVVSAPVSPGSAVPNPAVAPVKKKRKSVRFDFQVLGDDEDAGVLVQEPEQMDVDSPVNETNGSLSHELPQGRHPTLEKLSLDPVHWRTTGQGTQSSDKRLILGRTCVEATFDGLPLKSPTHHSWLSEFLDKETLEFQHTCFAATVAIKISSLVREPLASGTIVSKEGETGLGRVAKYLTAGLLGLYYGQTEYNILIFPTKCDEWKSIPLIQDPTSPAEAVALRYFIFASHQGCGLVLPPLAPVLSSTPQPAAENSKPENTETPSDRALIMKRLLGFEYSKLLPAIPNALQVHKIFLAVPESRKATLEALCYWLRASNPSCHIYTSDRPGGWAAYRADAKPRPGVVIIHETLAWSLRRFPNLSHLLITRNDEYWCLSEPVHSLPLYPSVSLPEDLVSPGDVRLSRLFPYRTAILLTPSFLVSEPRRTVELLTWFMSRSGGKFYYRLVTAWNIHEYLLELADEKYKARQALWGRHFDVQPEIAANLGGLSEEDCNLRFQAANLAYEMNMDRTAQAGLYGQEEDNGSLVYADSSIDPNDEQSLVNWFGWWTILHADQYRKLHVVGSSQAIKLHGSRKGERRVRIPKYSKVTLNDPEAVMEVFQERDDQAAEEKADAADSEPTPQVPDKGSRKNSHEMRSGSFQSDIIRSANIANMVSCLDELAAVPDGHYPGSKPRWILYKYPVSWMDLEMAEHFDDFAASYHRIQDWFKFAWPFKGGYNTYIGFFYTITEDWDPENLPESRVPERHPWLAIYRPVNPHIKPYSRCEVIIWDPAARTKFSTKKALAEKDLTFMQRQVIQHVRAEGDAKNPNTYIDQVWLGGFDWPPDCDSPYPLDVTLKFLRSLLKDLKEFLPAPDHVMTRRGYRKVAREADDDEPMDDIPMDIPMDISPTSSTADFSLFVNQTTAKPHEAGHSSADSSSEEDEDTRIIFHPPRGNNSHRRKNSNDNHHHQNRPNAFRSRCRNVLYEEARLALAHAEPGRPPPTHMTYRFPPTMDWYREQRAEGRDFAHINVDSWEPIFSILKIGEGAAAAAGGGEKQQQQQQQRETSAGGGGGGDERRRGSTGSG